MTEARDNVPELMQRLDRDGRGYPIPFSAFIDSQGTPQFTINDDHKRVRMIRGDLCSICGNKLLRGRWFIGGPGAAFDPRGAYLDMPMHDQCAHYALRVCPFIAAPNYSKRIEDRKLKGAQPDHVILIDETVEVKRPPLFVAVMAVGQRMTDGMAPGSYILPERPYRKVEYWRFGQQLDETEGLHLSAEELHLKPAEVRALQKSRTALLDIHRKNDGANSA